MKKNYEQAERMRGLAYAYPEEQFPPFSDEERIEHASDICRANAEMGRRLKGTFLDSAKLIDELGDEVQNAEARGEELARLLETERKRILELAAMLDKKTETHALQVERYNVLQKEAEQWKSAAESWEVRAREAEQKLSDAVNQGTRDRQSRNLYWPNELRAAVQENADDCNELTSAILKLGTKHGVMEDSTGWGDTLERLDRLILGGDSKIEELTKTLDETHDAIILAQHAKAPFIVGTEEGERCNRSGCEGIIVIDRGGKVCSCHNNPPCSACVDAVLGCPRCDWRAE